jgi:hypothetical protein
MRNEQRQEQSRPPASPARTAPRERASSLTSVAGRLDRRAAANRRRVDRIRTAEGAQAAPAACALTFELIRVSGLDGLADALQIDDRRFRLIAELAETGTVGGFVRVRIGYDAG